jgi:hypothetical protein
MNQDFCCILLSFAKNFAFSVVKTKFYQNTFIRATTLKIEDKYYSKPCSPDRNDTPQATARYEADAEEYKWIAG